MIARRAFLSALCTVTCTVAIAGEQSGQFVGHGRSASFRLSVPDGWRVAWSSEPGVEAPLGQRQVSVFEFARAVSNTTQSPAKPLSIRGFYYTDMVPVAARHRWEGVAGRLSTELPHVDGRNVWTISEIESMGTVTAYTQLGNDVLCIHLAVADRELLDLSKSDLLEMLRSYTEVPRIP